MSSCLVYSGVLFSSVSVSVCFVKSKNSDMYIRLSLMGNNCPFCYMTTLVSPLGQGGSDHLFRNFQFVSALFSPPERGIASTVLNLVFAK